MIELLCPSRTRPEKLKRMWDSARKTAFEPHNLYLNLGIHEAEIPLYKPHLDGNISIHVMRDWSTVHCYNAMAAVRLPDSDAKLFMILGDDTIFSTPGWDKALAEHYEKLSCKIHIYALQDSRDAAGTPHPVMTREYIAAMGYILCPIFLHWYVDGWAAEMAKDAGCFTHLKDYLLVHDKPSDQGEFDATHNRIREMGWRERDKFVDEKCRHFLDVEKYRLSTAVNAKKTIQERYASGV